MGTGASTEQLHATKITETRHDKVNRVENRPKHKQTADDRPPRKTQSSVIEEYTMMSESIIFNDPKKVRYNPKTTANRSTVKLF
jgi:hypothetical protein